MLKRLALSALLCAGSAHALEARDLDPNTPGHEAVYDSARDITWLADAGPTVTWYEAETFASSLTLGGFTGWRMALSGELNALFGDWYGAGITEFGAEFLFNGALNPDAGIGSTLFTNAGEREYWAGEANLAGDPRFALVMTFHRTLKDGGRCPKDSCLSLGWAVHDGDLRASAARVSPAPEPETYALMLAGIAMLAWRRHCSPAPMSGPAPSGRKLPKMSPSTGTLAPASLP
jgi:hypothetical protein